MIALRALLAAGGAIHAIVAGDAAAQAGKCKFLRIVDWPARVVRNFVVVDGAINGQKVGIALDTGAQKSIIVRAAAVRLELALREAKGYRMMGFGGETKVDIATVDDFKLGEVSTKGVQLFVAGEHDLDVGVDVLLGKDFLRRFDVEFDLPNDAVRLYQPRDCDNVSLAYQTKETVWEVAIDTVDERRPRISYTVHINGKPIEAILDSGATASVMTREHAASAGVTPESPGVAASRWGGLGADFIRAHRTLVSHSQNRLYFTYTGGPVFRADPAQDAEAARKSGAN